VQKVPTEGYESFSMYGLHIEYPDTWDVELNPKSDRTMGDVVFKTTRHRIFLSWGPLDRVQEKYGSLDRHAEAGLGKISKGSDVRKMETLEKSETTVNGHKAIFNRFRVTLGVSFFAMRTAYREISSFHLHCERNGKFYVLYESVMGLNSASGLEPIFQHMKDSFKCH
jgi:hypothetical protein